MHKVTSAMAAKISDHARSLEEITVLARVPVAKKSGSFKEEYFNLSQYHQRTVKCWYVGAKQTYYVVFIVVLMKFIKLFFYI
jgi:hypothetical protein